MRPATYAIIGYKHLRNGSKYWYSLQWFLQFAMLYIKLCLLCITATRALAEKSYVSRDDKAKESNFSIIVVIAVVDAEFQVFLPSVLMVSSSYLSLDMLIKLVQKVKVVCTSVSSRLQGF